MDPGPIFTIDTSSTVTVYLLQTTITFHTMRLILCYSKPVSLTTLLIRWDKVLSLCCAGLRVACNTCVTFPSSYWFDNLGFLLRETCRCAASYLALGVSNEASHDKCWVPSDTSSTVTVYFLQTTITFHTI